MTEEVKSALEPETTFVRKRIRGIMDPADVPLSMAVGAMIPKYPPSWVRGSAVEAVAKCCEMFAMVREAKRQFAEQGEKADSEFAAAIATLEV